MGPVSYTHLQLLNNKDLKFKGFFRTCVFLPCATSLVSYSLIFRSMFATDGLINSIPVSYTHLKLIDVLYFVLIYTQKGLFQWPSIGDGMNCTMTVSYTHLDVYKRQESAAVLLWSIVWDLSDLRSYTFAPRLC